MAIKGLDKLEKALQQYNGKDAVISTFHKLYGNQKIKCELDCITDEARIGFVIKNGQEIYMYKNEIKEFNVDNGLSFEDDVMRIDVQIK